MFSHKILDHTADIRMHVEASSLQELFLGALEGMNNIIKKNKCSSENPPQIKEIITLDSPDETALLIDFLSEVLTLTQINKCIFCKAKIEKLDSKSVVALVSGHKVDGFDEDIKAVTYAEAKIKKNEDGNLETMIVFDI